MIHDLGAYVRSKSTTSDIRLFIMSINVHSVMEDDRRKVKRDKRGKSEGFLFLFFNKQTYS